jgi:hypothetical protein
MQEGAQAGFRVARRSSIVSRFGMVVAFVGVSEDVYRPFQAICLLFVAGVSSELSCVERGFSLVSQAVPFVVVVVRRLGCTIVAVGTAFSIF